MPGIKHNKRYVPYEFDKKAPIDTTVEGAKMIIVRFQNAVGEALDNQFSIPASSTPDNLNLILNKIISPDDGDEPLPYAFTVDSREIARSLLADVILPMELSSSEAVIDITYSPQDGSMLATASGDSTIRVWDMSSQTPVATLAGHESWVQCLSWSPDMQFIVSGGMDKSVFVWDKSAFSSIKKKDTPTVKNGLKGHTGPITSIAWEPLHQCGETDGACTKFATSSKDGTVRVWNAVLKRVVYVLSQHTAPVMCVKWGGNGNIYTASRDKTIKIWNAIDTLKGHAHWINSIALSNEHLLRTGAFSPNAGLIDAPTSFENKQKAYQRAVERYSEHNKEELLVSCSDDFTLFLWGDAVKGDGKPVERMTGHQQLVNHVTFSPDGRFIASAGFDKGVKLWDAKTGKFITSFRGHVGAVYQVAFSPDSRLLVSSSKDSTCKVWDLARRVLKDDLPGHADEVFAVDWCPMGWAGASGGKDKTLKIWKA